MRITRLAGYALAAIFLTSATAGAQMATPVPDFKPNWSGMRFLLGTWTCRTTKNTAGRGTGRTETDVTTMSLDGHFMVTDSSSKPFDKARTRTIVTKSYQGWDPATHMWYSFSADNFGGGNWSESSGWVGNKATWKDRYNTDGAPLTTTVVTKVSDMKYTTANTDRGVVTTSECTKGM